MKVLVIGSGGREHALAWKLAESQQVTDLFAWPGNPGIAQLADCAAGSVMDFKGIEKFARQKQVDLVVVGPEDPLAAGLVDRLMAAGIKTFGPTQEAARLESDKWFAKEVMRQQAVPTAEAKSFTDPDAAEEYARNRDGAVVIKAAGLAKGKGVTLCYRIGDAIEAIDQIMRKRAFGDAGERVVIEEMLMGPECSVQAFVSDRSIYVMEPAQDHKPVEDGDTGPMTGGMGAYSPTPVIDDAMMRNVERQVLVPTVDALVRDGIHYRGVLYAGLMLTTTGPKVLEFNCRFGDPETQSLMMRLNSDLLEVMLATIDGKLDRANLKWDPRPAITVIAASKGYPGDYEKGVEITGVGEADAMTDVKVFHSGTKMTEGKLVTDGGRVLGVTALGDTIAAAQKRAYDAMAKIHFDGMHYRRDIAHQAIKLAR